MSAHNVEHPEDDAQQVLPPDARDAHDAHDETPPQLPAPQIDLSLSMDTILAAGTKDINSEEAQKLEKLAEENDKLDEKLKEMQDRLAAAEQKSKELEAKRQAER